MHQDFITELSQKNLHIQADVSLAQYCTMQVGGPAQAFIKISSVEEMQHTLSLCKKYSIRFHLVGKGSNTVFHDKGFKGLIIHNAISFSEQKEAKWHAGAGYSFSLLGTQTARKGWSGLEFASGIPGTVGGAVFMNAGANGRETCDSLSSVDFVDADGKLHTFMRKDLDFSYRTSPFQKMQGAIVAATFKLEPSDTARKDQIDIVHYRKETQPLSEPSSGCVFRNPTPLSAGGLIDKYGLKGLKQGGAEVSTQHANFIVNKGNATSEEIRSLVEEVKGSIKDTAHVKLKEEIFFIPYEEE